MRGLSTFPQKTGDVYTEDGASSGTGGASGADGGTSSSASVSLELKDSEELATFLVHSLGTEKDIKALCRNISTMRTNPSTKMLTLSRMALKTPSHCRWVCNWLWPILNGMKPLAESFPVSIPDSITNSGSFDNYTAVMVDSLDKIDAMLKSEDPNNVRRPESATTLTSYQITNRLASNVPYMVFENVATLLDGIASGESDATTVEKALRQSTIMHTDHMVDIYHFTGLGHGGYLDRYLRTSKTKKKKIQAELNSELSQLFAELQHDQQRESEFETAVQDGSVGERWQEISKFEQDRKRDREVTRGRDKRLGRKNTLYTYIRAERSEETDFGVDEWTHRHVQGRQYFNPSGDGDEHNDDGAFDYDDGADVDDIAAQMGIDTDVADADADADVFPHIDDSSLPIKKVFVGNLPRNVNGADVANALRNCGEVAKVWFYDTDAGVSSGSAEAKAERAAEADAGAKRGEAIGSDDGNVGLDLSKVSIEEVSSDSEGADNAMPTLTSSASASFSSDSEFEVGELEMEGGAALVEMGAGSSTVPTEREGDDEDVEEDLHNAFSAFLEGDDADGEGEDEDAAMKLSALGFRADGSGVEASSLLAGAASDDEEEVEDEDPDLRVAVARVRRLEDEEEEFKKKTKTLKKRLMRMQRGYNYAYVQMMDDKGYFNATRDEMRVFGVCINGYNCRIQEAMRLRTLVVEVLVPLRCSEIKHTLTANLGSWYNFNYYKGKVDIGPEEKTEMDRSKPIFVHLEFGSHEEAWKSFELLDNAFRAGQSDLKVSWVKSEWYWVVAKKARELSFTTSPKKAKSLEREIEELSAKEGDE